MATAKKTKTKSKAISQSTATMTRAEWAYSQIKERILGNVYEPGYQALEQEIAENLNVSRTPMREALIRLSQEGLVELIPRRGFRVVPVVAADMKEIYDVLTSLESMAAELLAQRGPSEEELAEMELATNDMESALERDDLDAWAAADERYHKSLIELCGNQRLAALANTVRDQGRRARMVTLRLRPKPTASTQEHRDVLDAIRKRDVHRAREMHYQHRRRASVELTDILRKYRLSHL
ncbi:MAG: GntR family transcriptional regulator [Xanthomonadales bacterium]|nr:GntR family transcriptional regulator [Xanthomonadales bacterium]